MAYRAIFVSLLLLFGTGTIDAFFASTNISYVGTRNISCGFQADVYSLLPYQSNITGGSGIFNMTLGSMNDFCFIEQINITLRNGSVVSTVLASAINGYNLLKQYASSRCFIGQSWSSVSPIGYGTCTQLPYEPETVKLCICSTNNCNVDYSTCVSSVQATQSSPPPYLPFSIPELTNIITCNQGYQGSTYSDFYYGTGWIYNYYTPFNMSAVRAYDSSHSVACALYVNAQTGDWYQLAVLYDEYPTILYLILLLKQLNALTQYAESSTSVSAELTSVYYTNASFYWYSNTFTEIICLCTTNNCNQDLSTCAIGLNASVSSTTGVSLPSTTSTIHTTILTSSATTSHTNTTTGATSTNAATGATMPSTSTSKPSGACFSGTSRVRREDGAVMMLRDISIGDHFLDSENRYSPVLTFFVDQQQGPMINYLQILTTKSTLEITPSHLILMRRQGDTSPPRYLQAARLHPGDSIFSIEAGSNGTMKETKVIRVLRNVKRTDAFAPLTDSGTLVVDDIIVSCYAQYEHHSLIHLIMFPFRIFNKIKHQTFDQYQQNELHSYIQFWLHASHFLDLLIHTV